MDRRKLRWVLAGVGVGAVGLGLVHFLRKPATKTKTSTKDVPDTKNKPPGARDVPRAPRSLTSEEVNGPDGALEFIGEEVAARSIRDGRPTLYVVLSQGDRDAGKHKALRAELSKRALAAGDHHSVTITTKVGPEDTALVGAIYQQANGIWSATLPSPDLVLVDGEYDPVAAFDKLLSFADGSDEPADFSELTPEQARLVREGATVTQAVEQTQASS